MKTISPRLCALISAMMASSGCFSLDAPTMNDLIKMADDPSKIRIVDVPEKIVTNCERYDLVKRAVTGDNYVCSAKTKTYLGGWDKYLCASARGSSATDACVPSDAPTDLALPGAGYHWWWVSVIVPYKMERRPDSEMFIMKENVPELKLMPTCVGLERPLFGNAYFAETMDLDDIDVMWQCVLGVERDSNGTLLGTSKSNPRSGAAQMTDKEEFLSRVRAAGIKLGLE